MNSNRYLEDPEIIDEFENMLLETCTFVKDWNDEIITPTIYRLYGKQFQKDSLPRNM